MTDSLARKASLVGARTRQAPAAACGVARKRGGTHLAFDSFWFSSVAVCVAATRRGVSQGSDTRRRLTASHLNRSLQLDLQALELLDRRIDVLLLGALVLRA